MLHQDPSQRPSAREAMEALIAIDASAHINGPLRLYPTDLTVPAHSNLMSVLAAAIPDISMQLLLQKIAQRVTSHASGAFFTNEMKTYGLTLLEACCICAYTCDATDFGQTREESPFYMYDRQCACALPLDCSYASPFSYNKALRDADLGAVARWADFSLLFDSGLSKLPAVKCTVYRSVPLPCGVLLFAPTNCAQRPGLQSD